MTIPFDRNAHATRATLVLVADREADPGTAAAVESHLDSCSECRARMMALEAAIHEFHAARRERIDEVFPAAETHRARLKARLAELAARRNRSHWSGGFRNISVPVIRWGYAASAAAAVALVAIVSFSVFAPVMSAKEFLVRAAAAQSSRSAHGSRIRPVRIRLQGKEFDQRSEETQGRRIFTKARLNWDDPLSPVAFAHWHDSVAEKNDEVSRSNGLLTLTTTTQTDSVLEASYSVENDTWLPVSERLALRDGTTVEITAAPNLSASQIDTPESAPSTNPDSKLVPEPEIASAMGPSPAQRNETTAEDAEVFARVALRKVGADEGGQIEFRRLGASALSVSTLVESEERQQALVKALAAIPGVRPDIRTFAEAAGRSSGPPRRATPDTAVAATAVPEFQHELDAVFSDAANREAFVNSVLSESQRAGSEAWETGLLLRRYLEPDLQKLGPAAREALEVLIREHVDALSQAIRRIAVQMKPLEDLGQSGGKPEPPVGTWREQLLLLTQRTLSLHAEIQEALVASSPTRNVEQLRNAIDSDLQWLDAGLEAPRRKISGHFLQNE